MTSRDQIDISFNPTYERTHEGHYLNPFPDASIYVTADRPRNIDLNEVLRRTAASDDFIDEYPLVQRTRNFLTVGGLKAVQPFVFPYDEGAQSSTKVPLVEKFPEMNGELKREGWREKIMTRNSFFLRQGRKVERISPEFDSANVILMRLKTKQTGRIRELMTGIETLVNFMPDSTLAQWCTGAATSDELFDIVSYIHNRFNTRESFPNMAAAWLAADKVAFKEGRDSQRAFHAYRNAFLEMHRALGLEDNNPRQLFGKVGCFFHMMLLPYLGIPRALQALAQELDYILSYTYVNGILPTIESLRRFRLEVIPDQDLVDQSGNLNINRDGVKYRTGAVASHEEKGDFARLQDLDGDVFDAKRRINKEVLTALSDTLEHDYEDDEEKDVSAYRPAENFVETLHSNFGIQADVEYVNEHIVALHTLMEVLKTQHLEAFPSSAVFNVIEQYCHDVSTISELEGTVEHARQYVFERLTTASEQVESRLADTPSILIGDNHYRLKSLEAIRSPEYMSDEERLEAIQSAKSEILMLNAEATKIATEFVRIDDMSNKYHQAIAVAGTYYCVVDMDVLSNVVARLIEYGSHSSDLSNDARPFEHGDFLHALQGLLLLYLHRQNLIEYGKYDHDATSTLTAFNAFQFQEYIDTYEIPNALYAELDDMFIVPDATRHQLIEAIYDSGIALYKDPHTEYRVPVDADLINIAIQMLRDRFGGIQDYMDLDVEQMARKRAELDLRYDTVLAQYNRAKNMLVETRRAYRKDLVGVGGTSTELVSPMFMNTTVARRAEDVLVSSGVGEDMEFDEEKELLEDMVETEFARVLEWLHANYRVISNEKTMNACIKGLTEQIQYVGRVQPENLSYLSEYAIGLYNNTMSTDEPRDPTMKFIKLPERLLAFLQSPTDFTPHSSYTSRLVKATPILESYIAELTRRKSTIGYYLAVKKSINSVSFFKIVTGILVRILFDEEDGGTLLRYFAYVRAKSENINAYEPMQLLCMHAVIAASVLACHIVGSTKNTITLNAQGTIPRFDSIKAINAYQTGAVCVLTYAVPFLFAFMDKMKVNQQKYGGLQMHPVLYAFVKDAAFPMAMQYFEELPSGYQRYATFFARCAGLGEDGLKTWRHAVGAGRHTSRGVAELPDPSAAAAPAAVEEEFVARGGSGMELEEKEYQP